MNKLRSRSGLFLMELIMAIFFFTIAATVSTQMFVKSHLLSQKSVETNHAVILCQNIAECFSACDTDASLMSRTLEECIFSENDNSLIQNYDKDFHLLPQNCNPEDIQYRLIGIITDSKNLKHLNVNCINLLKNENIYSIDYDVYPSRKDL